METIALPPLFYKTCSGYIFGLLKPNHFGGEDFLVFVSGIYFLRCLDT